MFGDYSYQVESVPTYEAREEYFREGYGLENSISDRSDERSCQETHQEWRWTIEPECTSNVCLEGGPQTYDH